MRTNKLRFIKRDPNRLNYLLKIYKLFVKPHKIIYNYVMTSFIKLQTTPSQQYH
jgi:hypothetical protein